MRRKCLWLAATVFLGVAPTACEQLTPKYAPEQAQPPPGQGGAGAAGEAPPQPGEGELVGPVRGYAGRRLFVAGPHGESVPFEVSHHTLMNGKPPRKDRLQNQLEQHFHKDHGVRVRYRVEDGSGKRPPRNVATAIDAVPPLTY